MCLCERGGVNTSHPRGWPVEGMLPWLSAALPPPPLPDISVFVFTPRPSIHEI